MTISDIMTVSRRILQDSISPYRWSDAELKKDLQFAIRELHKIRPETRYVNGELTDGVILPTADDATIGIDDRYEESLAYYVVYMAYLNDSSDTVNQQLADTYLNKFNTKAQI